MNKLRRLAQIRLAHAKYANSQYHSVQIQSQISLNTTHAYI